MPLLSLFSLLLSLLPPSLLPCCRHTTFIALQSLATFPDQVCEDNLKEVGKLAGVGKGTIKRVSE